MTITKLTPNKPLCCSVFLTSVNSVVKKYISFIYLNFYDFTLKMTNIIAINRMLTTYAMIRKRLYAS
jgi:hypothetical protein